MGETRVKVKAHFFAAALMVCLGLGTTPAWAVSVAITPTNFDTITLGNQVGSTLVSNFWTPDHVTNFGTLTSMVWEYTGAAQANETYIYQFIVTLDTSLITTPREVNTAFNVLGFDPTIHRAGFSFSDATAAGAGLNLSNLLTSAFYIIREDDGTIDFNVNPNQRKNGLNFWRAPNNLKPMTFFFESSLPPGLGDINFRDGLVGSANSYAPAPVPEPTTLLLLGSGLLGLGGAAWRRKHRKQS